MATRKLKTNFREVRNKESVLILREHYVDGKLQDGPKGEAAIEEFRPDGSLHRRMRYAAGQRANGAKGEPGIEEFDALGKQTYKAYIADLVISAKRPRRKRLTNLPRSSAS